MPPEPRLVYDVGMHEGEDTAFYLAQGHRVVAVEADPRLAGAARRRFAAEVADGRLRVLNVGIAPEEGEAEFWVCEGRPYWSSFDREVATRAGETATAVRVPTRRFASILAAEGVPHYLKIDIEGSDALCLTALDSAHLPPYLSIEAECGAEGRLATTDEALETLRTLRGLGYRRFKLVSQWTHAPLTVPPSPAWLVDRVADRVEHGGGLPFRLLRKLGLGPATARLRVRRRLSRRHGWTFDEGSSGPWGEDAPGPWLDGDQAERTFRHWRERHFRRADVAPYSFWCDWHAAL